MSKYALGLDFGTLDGRAILVDVKEEIVKRKYFRKIINED